MQISCKFPIFILILQLGFIEDLWLPIMSSMSESDRLFLAGVGIWFTAHGAVPGESPPPSPAGEPSTPASRKGSTQLQVLTGSGPSTHPSPSPHPSTQPVDPCNSSQPLRPMSLPPPLWKPCPNAPEKADNGQQRRPAEKCPIANTGNEVRVPTHNLPTPCAWCIGPGRIGTLLYGTLPAAIRLEMLFWTGGRSFFWRGMTRSGDDPFLFGGCQLGVTLHG